MDPKLNLDKVSFYCVIELSNRLLLNIHKNMLLYFSLLFY